MLIAPKFHIDLFFLVSLLLTCLTFASLGILVALLAKTHEDMATFSSLILLPMTFLGGTYYPWTSLSAIQVGGFPWLQALVCINPLIYVTEGFRAALTTMPHMPLYVLYPVLVAFCALPRRSLRLCCGCVPKPAAAARC